MYRFSLYTVKSRHSQKLGEFNKYWKAKAQYCHARMDDVPATNSEDSRDHSCTPMDTRAASMESPPQNHLG